MSPLFAATNQSGMPPYFIGWGTLSLINAGLAQSKGHSGMAWWLLSLLLGPLATFVIVVFLQPLSVPSEWPSAPPQSRQDKPMFDPDMYDDLA